MTFIDKLRSFQERIRTPNIPETRTGNNAYDSDWSRISNFIKPEFPMLTNGESVLKYLSMDVIDVLQQIRTEASVPFTTSPVAGAYVRHQASGSRHSTQNKTRLSDAVDLFFNRQSFYRVYDAIMTNASVGGFGLYFDKTFNGQSRPMFHIDLRNDRMYWVTNRAGTFIYMHSNPKQYFQTIADNL